MSRVAGRLPEALVAASLCSVLCQLLIVDGNTQKTVGQIPLAAWPPGVYIKPQKHVISVTFVSLYFSLFVSSVAAVPRDAVYLQQATSLFARTSGTSTRVPSFIQGKALFLELLRVLRSAPWVEAPKMCSAVCARIPPKWQPGVSVDVPSALGTQGRVNHRSRQAELVAKQA